MSYTIREVIKGKKVIPVIENKCSVGKIEGKQYAFLKIEPIPIYSADTFHFSIPENLVFEI
jgi:hypothetical protein